MMAEFKVVAECHICGKELLETYIEGDGSTFVLGVKPCPVCMSVVQLVDDFLDEIARLKKLIRAVRTSSLVLEDDPNLSGVGARVLVDADMWEALGKI